MVIAAMAEVGGGGGTMAAGTLTMEAGVATLVIPGVGEVTFVVAEAAGIIEFLGGAALVAHGEYLLEMAQENQSKKVGYRKGNVPPSQRDKKRTFSKKQVDKKYNENQGKCEYCGDEAPRADYRGDHRKAHAKGGRTTEDNLAGSCRGCNSAKSDKDIGTGSGEFNPVKQ